MGVMTTVQTQMAASAAPATMSAFPSPRAVGRAQSPATSVAAPPRASEAPAVVLSAFRMFDVPSPMMNACATRSSATTSTAANEAHQACFRGCISRPSLETTIQSRSSSDPSPASHHSVPCDNIAITSRPYVPISGVPDIRADGGHGAGWRTYRSLEVAWDRRDRQSERRVHWRRPILRSLLAPSVRTYGRRSNPSPGSAFKLRNGPSLTRSQARTY